MPDGEGIETSRVNSKPLFRAHGRSITTSRTLSAPHACRIGNRAIHSAEGNAFYWQAPNPEVRHFCQATLSNGSTQWRTWTTNDTKKNVVRQAFDVWRNISIGLEFKEVTSREEAEIRIGFMRSDGAWSYVGRDILNQGSSDHSLNECRAGREGFVQNCVGFLALVY
jgi:hypothetical protein